MMNDDNESSLISLIWPQKFYNLLSDEKKLYKGWWSECEAQAEKTITIILNLKQFHNFMQIH